MHGKSGIKCLRIVPAKCINMRILNGKKKNIDMHQGYWRIVRVSASPYQRLVEQTAKDWFGTCKQNELSIFKPNIYLSLIHI